MSEELSYCPFCGSTDVTTEHGPSFYGHCNNCEAEGPWNDESEVDAIAAWNRRATPPSPSTAPTVEVDKHAAFEAAMLEQFGEDETFDRDMYGCYINRSWHDAFIGWKIGRASKPPAREAAIDMDHWSNQPPTEQADYWHWDGDEDHAPMIYHVLWSGSAKKCFVSIGQYDIREAIWCDKFGGWWKRIPTPSTPNATER